MMSLQPLAVRGTEGPTQPHLPPPVQAASDVHAVPSLLPLMHCDVGQITGYFWQLVIDLDGS